MAMQDIDRGLIFNPDTQPQKPPKSPGRGFLFRGLPYLVGTVLTMYAASSDSSQVLAWMEEQKYSQYLASYRRSLEKWDEDRQRKTYWSKIDDTTHILQTLRRFRLFKSSRQYFHNVYPVPEETNGSAFIIDSASLHPDSVFLTDPAEKNYRAFITKDGNKYQRPIDLPPEIQQGLQDTVESINKLLPPISRMHTIRAYTLLHNQFQVALNGHPLYKDKGIELEIMPDTEIPVKALYEAAWHEGMHYFESTLRNHGEAWYEFIRINDLLLSEEDQAMPKLGEHMRSLGFTENEISSYQMGIISDHLGKDARADLGALHNLVNEGYYFNTSGGHPYDGFHELFASTSGVLRFKPFSFMASVRRLPEEKQQLMKSLAKATIELLKSGAVDPAEVDKLFYPELLDFINTD